MSSFYHNAIIGLLFPHGQRVIRVGENGITAIKEEAVYGEMSMVPWFSIQRGDQVMEMVNAAHVETVEYAEAQVPPDQIPF